MYIYIMYTHWHDVGFAAPSKYYWRPPKTMADVGDTYFLRVIPTNWSSICDTYSDIISGILSDIYSDILSAFFLAYKFWDSIWHSAWHFIWIWYIYIYLYIYFIFSLTFYLAFYLTYISLYSILTFYLAFSVAFYATSGARRWSPAVPTDLRFGFGSAHWAVAGKRQANFDKI
jgi:CHASE2 domain-containing sensor protein